MWYKIKAVPYNCSISIGCGNILLMQWDYLEAVINNITYQQVIFHYLITLMVSHSFDLGVVFTN